MKSVFFNISLLFVLMACTPSKTDVRIEKDSSIFYRSDSLQAIVFKDNHVFHTLRYNRAIPVFQILPVKPLNGWNPELADIKRFQVSFSKYWRLAKTDSLAKMNNLTPITWKRIDLFDYQIIGFIDSTHARKMVINIGNWDEFAISEPTSWKTEWIAINDTYGESFWSIYNADTDSIEVLEWN